MHVVRATKATVKNTLLTVALLIIRDASQLQRS